MTNTGVCAGASLLVAESVPRVGPANASEGCIKRANAMRMLYGVGSLELARPAGLWRAVRLPVGQTLPSSFRKVHSVLGNKLRKIKMVTGGRSPFEQLRRLR